MKLPKKKAFGELEETLFTLIQNKRTATVKELYEALNGQSAYTTIMTVVDRLYKKGLLKRTKEQRSFVYSTRATLPLKSSFSSRLKKLFFKNSTFEVIQHLLEEDNDLSEEELHLLEQKIQQVKNGQ